MRDAYAEREARHAALHRAAFAGYQDAVASLLDAGADVNARDRQGWTPLARAIQQGHPELALWLLERGADVNAEDVRGRTPLLWAAQYGTVGVARALLERGAEPVVRIDSPLRVAIQHRRADVAELLLAAEGWSRWPDTVREKHIQSAFRLAVELGLVGAVRAFFRHPAGAADAGQRRFLSSTLAGAAARGHTKVAQFLIERGANPNVPDWQGVTPLAEALRAGREGIAAVLRELGAQLDEKTVTVAGQVEPLEAGLARREIDPNSADSRGVTLLMRSVQFGQPDVARLLLRYGADANAHDKGGATALFRAAEAGSLPLLELLLEHGADPLHEADGLRTALSDAALRGSADAVRFLLEHAESHGKRWNPPALDFALACAVMRRSQASARLLLAAGAHPDRATFSEVPALVEASRTGDREMVRLLLTAGADIHREGGHGYPPLVAALSAGRWRTAALLLEAGADPNHKGSSHGSALYLAVHAGRVDMVRLLLEKGADPNSRGWDHDNCLDRAMKTGHLELIAVLAAAGAT